MTGNKFQPPLGETASGQAAYLVINQGFHPPAPTAALLADLGRYEIWQALTPVVIPAQPTWRVLSAYALRQALLSALGRSLAEAIAQPPQLFFLAFSGGCVGAAGAARHWHSLGCPVTAFFAVDGWGLPLVLPFPVHRLSHDLFTHQSSLRLGRDRLDFYADPAAAHLDLWRCPSQIGGYQVEADGFASDDAGAAAGATAPAQTTAAAFIAARLAQALGQS